MLTLGQRHVSLCGCLGEGRHGVSRRKRERFTRIKHGKQPVPFSTWQLPCYAIDYCLSQRPHTRAGAIWPSISRAGIRCCRRTVLRWMKASDALSAQAHRRSASRHLTSRWPIMLLHRR